MISQYGSNLNNISNEVLYLHYLKIRPDLHRLVPKEYFDNKMISVIYEILKSFQKKYSQTPTFEQIRIIIDNKKYDEFYDGDKKFKIEDSKRICSFWAFKIIILELSNTSLLSFGLYSHTFGKNSGERNTPLLTQKFSGLIGSNCLIRLSLIATLGAIINTFPLEI